jgi:hypothetical protein
MKNTELHVVYEQVRAIDLLSLEKKIMTATSFYPRLDWSSSKYPTDTAI